MKRLVALTALMALTVGPAAAVSGGGYSLTIKDRPADYQGYVRLPHGQHYSVCFSNQSGERSDAELSIDGLDMGVWRLEPWQSACVDRPATDTGMFTFYRADTPEGQQVGAAYVTPHDKGRVRVNFYPELYTPPPPQPVPVPDSAPSTQGYSSQGYGAPAPQAMQREAPAIGNAAPAMRRASPGLGSGVTGLEGTSKQQFGSTGAIQRDYDRMVTLEVRLIHDPAMDPPPPGPRPLPGRFNQYAPPPIGN